MAISSLYYYMTTSYEITEGEPSKKVRRPDESELPRNDRLIITFLLRFYTVCVLIIPDIISVTLF